MDISALPVPNDKQSADVDSRVDFKAELNPDTNGLPEVIDNREKTIFRCRYEPTIYYFSAEINSLKALCPVCFLKIKSAVSQSGSNWPSTSIGLKSYGIIYTFTANDCEKFAFE